MEEEPEVTDGEDYVDLEELAWIAYMMINTNVRIYDVLISLLSVIGGSEKAKQLQQLHEAGGYLFPPPYLEPDGE